MNNSEWIFIALAALGIYYYITFVNKKSRRVGGKLPRDATQKKVDHPEDMKNRGKHFDHNLMGMISNTE